MPDRHSRARGSPGRARGGKKEVDSRVRGNDNIGGNNSIRLDRSVHGIGIVRQKAGAVAQKMVAQPYFRLSQPILSQ